MALFEKKGSQEPRLWAQIPLFRGLGRRELQEVERSLKVVDHPASEKIFEQGKPGNGAFIILSGGVDIVQEEADGAMLKLAHVGPGGLFGELALLDDSPRTATALTTEPTQVAALYRADLLSLAEAKPRLGVKVVMELSQIVAERLRRTNRSLKEVRLEAESTEPAEGVG